MWKSACSASWHGGDADFASRRHVEATAYCGFAESVDICSCDACIEDEAQSLFVLPVALGRQSGGSVAPFHVACESCKSCRRVTLRWPPSLASLVQTFVASQLAFSAFILNSMRPLGALHPMGCLPLLGTFGNYSRWFMLQERAGGNFIVIAIQATYFAAQAHVEEIPQEQSEKTSESEEVDSADLTDWRTRISNFV